MFPAALPDIRTLFLKKELDAAWVPEPWLTLLVREGGGDLLLDERSLWPDGRFVTTHLIASAQFLADRRDLAREFVAAHSRLTLWISGHAEEAQRLVNGRIEVEIGRAMEESVLREAWSRIRFTDDPLRPSLETIARRAFELGFLGKQPPDLENLYDLSLRAEAP